MPECDYCDHALGRFDLNLGYGGRLGDSKPGFEDGNTTPRVISY